MIRPLRLAAVCSSALAVAAPAAHAAGPSPSAPSAPSTGNSLWYRLSVSVSGTYGLDWRNGDTETQKNSWSLRANTAILVKRICVLPGSPLSPQQLAATNGLPLRHSSCDDLRHAMSPALRAQFGSRLREDFSVNANATGKAATWSRSVIYGPRDVIHNGKTTRCPGGNRLDKQLSSPVTVFGAISGSARNGITAGFFFPTGNLAAATETQTGVECRDSEGSIVAASGSRTRDVKLFADVLAGAYAPVHGGGNGSEFAAGPLGLDAVKVGNAGHLFGRSFTLTGGVPQTHTFSDGSSSRKTVSYTIRFELCPNGGRNVRGC